MDDFEPLAGRDIWHLVMAVQDGEATANDARRLLAEFHDRVTRQEDIPRPLLVWLRDAFAEFLQGKAPIEAALGLKRRRAGHPGADAERELWIAEAVLRERLAGASHQDALATAGKTFACGATKAGVAWKRHKRDAWIVVRIARHVAEEPWRAEELQRLAAMFEGDPLGEKFRQAVRDT